MGPCKPDVETVLVDMEPIRRQARSVVGRSLLQAAEEAGVELVSLCGGEGRCAGCRIRLIEGALSPPSQTELDALPEESLAAGYRLACQALLRGDVRIEIPPESLSAAQRLQVEGLGSDKGMEVDPPVRLVGMRLEPPALDDTRADATRLKEALAEGGHGTPEVDLPVLVDLSDRLRSNAWSARLALRGDKVVAVLPPEGRMLGLAVDIGTTKLAGYLLDLGSGETLAKLGVMNPQVAYGEDVVSRIAYTDKNLMGRRILQSRLFETLNEMVVKLCAQIGAHPDEILEALLVGNTVMHHLATGLPVHQLAVAPFVPAVTEALDLPARDLRLSLAPNAYVHLPPNISGYMGSDHIAVILATGIWQSTRTAVAVDVGTNTEITLAAKGRMLSCSCASGPAFEGAHIRDGMRAAPGAIERVQFVGGEVHMSTVGGGAPLGICGSGILDAVAGLRESGLLSETGGFQRPHPRVHTDRRGCAVFQLVPAVETGHGREIRVTRRDISEIQLAKAAIRAGLDVLMLEAGVRPEDIEEFFVAGAFGLHINVPSAIRVGMLPNLPITRFRQVGNAAGFGARQMLLSARLRQAAVEIGQRVEYVELTAHPAFKDAFRRSVYL
jgi:uncharacterized 2Fe-2S/4Fe-4S cluster protein (DUF4445 family)